MKFILFNTILVIVGTSCRLADESSIKAANVAAKWENLNKNDLFRIADRNDNQACFLLDGHTTRYSRSRCGDVPYFKVIGIKEKNYAKKRVQSLIETNEKLEGQQCITKTKNGLLLRPCKRASDPDLDPQLLGWSDIGKIGKIGSTEYALDVFKEDPESLSTNFTRFSKYVQPDLKGGLQITKTATTPVNFESLQRYITRAKIYTRMNCNQEEYITGIQFELISTHSKDNVDLNEVNVGVVKEHFTVGGFVPWTPEYNSDGKQNGVYITDEIDINGDEFFTKIEATIGNGYCKYGVKAFKKIRFWTNKGNILSPLPREKVEIGSLGIGISNEFAGAKVFEISGREYKDVVDYPLTGIIGRTFKLDGIPGIYGLKFIGVGPDLLKVSNDFLNSVYYSNKTILGTNGLSKPFDLSLDADNIFDMNHWTGMFGDSVGQNSGNPAQITIFSNGPGLTGIKIKPRVETGNIKTATLGTPAPGYSSRDLDLVMEDNEFVSRVFYSIMNPPDVKLGAIDGLGFQITKINDNDLTVSNRFALWTSVPRYSTLDRPRFVKERSFGKKGYAITGFYGKTNPTDKYIQDMGVIYSKLQNTQGINPNLYPKIAQVKWDNTWVSRPTAIAEDRKLCIVRFRTGWSQIINQECFDPGEFSEYLRPPYKGDLGHIHMREKSPYPLVTGWVTHSLLGTDHYYISGPTKYKKIRYLALKKVHYENMELYETRQCARGSFGVNATNLKVPPHLKREPRNSFEDHGNVEGDTYYTQWGHAGFGRPALGVANKGNYLWCTAGTSAVDNQGFTGTTTVNNQGFFKIDKSGWNPNYNQIVDEKFQFIEKLTESNEQVFLREPLHRYLRTVDSDRFIVSTGVKAYKFKVIGGGKTGCANNSGYGSWRSPNVPISKEDIKGNFNRRAERTLCLLGKFTTGREQSLENYTFYTYGVGYEPCPASVYTRAHDNPGLDVKHIYVSFSLPKFSPPTDVKPQLTIPDGAWGGGVCVLRRGRRVEWKNLKFECPEGTNKWKVNNYEWRTGVGINGCKGTLPPFPSINGYYSRDREIPPCREGSAFSGCFER